MTPLPFRKTLLAVVIINLACPTLSVAQTLTNSSARGELYINGGDIQSLINTGTIQADDTAIKIEGFTDDQPLIENTGNIFGGVTAIDATGALNYPAGTGVEMKWNAGMIKGNMVGMHEVAIEGSVIFDGQSLASRFIDLGWTDDSLTGHLDLKQAHTTLVTDNLQVAEGASLGLNLSSATNPQQAIVTVTGKAIFETNSQIRLAARGSDFSVDGTSYTLLQAGELVDEGLRVVSSSALLTVDSYSVDGNTIVSNVTAKGSDEVANDIANNGASGNAQTAITRFSPLMSNLGTNNPSDPVFQAFANADEAQLAELAEQLTPDVSGASAKATVAGQNLISNAVVGRTSTIRGLSSGDSFNATGIWMQGLYSDAEQQRRNGVAGYNAYSQGLAIGADGKATEQLTLGLAYSFLDTKVNGATGNKTAVEGHAFTLYSGFESGAYFIDGNLTYGINDNSGKRQIASSTARSDYDSELLGLNLVGGYTYRINNNFLVEPRLASRYSNVQIDGYTEKGSAAALKVEKQRYESFDLGAGVRVAGSYPLAQGRIEPQAKLMAYHDFAADRASSTSTFVLGGTPFVTSGAKPARNSYEVGIGVDYLLGAVTIGANYEYVGKSGFNADTFTAKVRYDF
jgi:outer membrane autotransporter protein